MHEPWLQTFSGKIFHPLDPNPEEICIEDIAHCLANICRFHGSVNRFYSVAEHSCHISRYCDPKYALEGLMHDASEAYIIDVPSPVKYELPKYKIIEKRIEKVIAQKWNLVYNNGWPET